MSKIINWLNNREFIDGDYLGNLCHKDHQYRNTGKSVRCKPTDRKNGKCVCNHPVHSSIKSYHPLKNEDHHKY